MKLKILGLSIMKLKKENVNYEKAEKVKQEALQEEALILEENICLDC